jgi:hypothetical protein
MTAATASAKAESVPNAALFTAPVSEVSGFPAETAGVFWSCIAHSHLWIHRLPTSQLINREVQGDADVRQGTVLKS